MCQLQVANIELRLASIENSLCLMIIVFNGDSSLVDYFCLLVIFSFTSRFGLKIPRPVG